MRPIPTPSGPPALSVLASAAGIGSGVGALGGGAGMVIFVPFALLDPAKSGGSGGAGLAIFAVPIAMAVGAIIGLLLALALAVALLATEWMGNAMIAFPAVAALASVAVMVAWSADLSVLSRLAVATLSGLASGWITQAATQRTDIDGAARAARRQRAEEPKPAVSDGWRIISAASVIPILGAVALRSNVQYGLTLGLGWVDLTWWARNWTHVPGAARELGSWLYLATFVPAGLAWTVRSKRPKRVVARLVLLAVLIECFEATFLWQFASTGDVLTAGVGALLGVMIGQAVRRRDHAPAAAVMSSAEGQVP